MESTWTLGGYGDGKTKAKLCSICGRPYKDFGHNPQPVKPDYEARCCDDCNKNVVVPARMVRINKGQSPY